MPGMACSLETASTHLRDAVRAASRGLVDRGVLIELVALAAVAREHVLIVGPPGTAKSAAVRSIAAQLQGRYFEYLIGRFTEPTDVFGAIDLVRLRQGEVAVQTAGMLPEAEVAFLDEVFLGSTAILNTLLALLNERTFTRGHTRLECPLRVCVAASNVLPEEPALEAFADRFLLRAFVEPLPDEMLETLLEEGWRSQRPEAPCSHIAEIDQLAQAARNLDLAPVRPALARAIRTLREAGILLGDRRVVKTQRLVAAAAVIGGRSSPSPSDLWPLIYAVPTAEQQTIAREALHDQLASSDSESLLAAAEQASSSPATRARRLHGAIEELLQRHEGAPPRLAAEALLREVAATFASESTPEPLAVAAERLAQTIEDAPAEEGSEMSGPRRMHEPALEPSQLAAEGE